MDGRVWLYFLQPNNGSPSFAIRADPFGLTNYVGLCAIAIITLLLGTSSNLAIKRIGAFKWKRLQRYNYIGAVMVFFHGAIYQILESRSLSGPTILLLCAFIILGLQAAGFRATSMAAARSEIPSTIPLRGKKQVFTQADPE